jgi:hypothetical protein
MLVFSVKKLNRRDHLGYLGADGRIILKWIERNRIRWDGYDLE